MSIAIHSAEPAQSTVTALPTAAPSSSSSAQLSFQQTLAASGQEGGAEPQTRATRAIGGSSTAGSGGQAGTTRAEKKTTNRSGKDQTPDSQSLATDPRTEAVPSQAIPIVPMQASLAVALEETPAAGAQGVQQSAQVNAGVVAEGNGQAQGAAAFRAEAALAQTAVSQNAVGGVRALPAESGVGNPASALAPVKSSVKSGGLSVSSASADALSAQAKLAAQAEMKGSPEEATVGATDDSMAIALRFPQTSGTSALNLLKQVEPVHTLPDSGAAAKMTGVGSVAPAAGTFLGAAGLTQSATQSGGQGNSAQGDRGEARQGTGEASASSPSAVSVTGTGAANLAVSVSSQTFSADGISAGLNAAAAASPSSVSTRESSGVDKSSAMPGVESSGGIDTARVLESMSGTEMRVGMHSAEFGSISIATTVSQGSVAAQIALEHGALGQALAAHLPAIEEKLGSALGVSARVEVRDMGAGMSQGGNGNAGGGTASGNTGSGNGQHSSGGTATPLAAVRNYAGAPSQIARQPAVEGRLSIQA